MNKPSPKYSNCKAFMVWSSIICIMIHPVIITPPVMHHVYHCLRLNTILAAAMVQDSPGQRNNTRPGIKKVLKGVVFSISCCRRNILPSGYSIIILPQTTAVTATRQSNISKMTFIVCRPETVCVPYEAKKCFSVLFSKRPVFSVTRIRKTTPEILLTSSSLKGHWEVRCMVSLLISGNFLSISC